MFRAIIVCALALSGACDRRPPEYTNTTVRPRAFCNIPQTISISWNIKRADTQTLTWHNPRSTSPTGTRTLSPTDTHEEVTVGETTRFLLSATNAYGKHHGVDLAEHVVTRKTHSESIIATCIDNSQFSGGFSIGGPDFPREAIVESVTLVTPDVLTVTAPSGASVRLREGAAARLTGPLVGRWSTLTPDVGCYSGNGVNEPPQTQTHTLQIVYRCP